MIAIRFHRCAASVAVLIALCGSLHVVSVARAQITPSEKNMMMATHFAAFSRGFLIAAFGPTNDVLLSSGSFSDTGWSLRVQGNWGARPMDVTWTAAFNPATGAGTYDSTGVIDGGPWDGAGSWTFVDTILNEADMDYQVTEGIALSLQASTFGRVKQTSNKAKKNPDGSIQTAGNEDYITQNGVIISGPVKKASRSAAIDPGIPTRIVTVDLSDPVYANIIFNTTTGAFAGVVDVPEPASASVVMSMASISLMRMPRARRRLAH